MKIKFSVAIALMVLVSVGAEARDRLVYMADLTGAAELEPVETETTGSFKMWAKGDASSARARLKIRNGVRLTQAHIHCGPEDANGPVVAFLAGFHELGWDVEGKWTKVYLTDENIIPNLELTDACPYTIGSLEDLMDVMADGNAYINVHSVANPSGEIRGQVSLKGRPSDS